MKKFLGSFAFIVLSLLAAAQAKNAGQSDPNAKKILDAVSAKFKTFKGVKATFIFKNEDNKGKVLKLVLFL